MKKGLVFSLMLLLSPLFVGAQVAVNTSLVGSVTDATGGALVGAHVTAINVDTKVPYDAVTNAEGYYDITGQVNPGTYNITVEQAGFSKEQKTGVILTLNLSVRTDFALKPGATSTEVTVSANTPAIQTDDSLLGETVSEKMIEDLPMNGRNAIDLAATASNITVTSDSAALTGVPPGQTASGAGTRGINNSITLDGISIMNSLITTTTVTPNPDTVSAVQTQNGNYTAQYGDYIGVHINEATKSGSNAFHGAAFEYIQNDAFNSLGFNHGLLPIAPKTHFRYDQYGGVLSGPIIIPWLYNGRDKTFFMGSYQGLRQKQVANGFTTSWTPAMRNGDFSIYINPTLNGTAGPNAKDTLLYSPYDGHAYYNLATGTQQINDQTAANRTIVNNILSYTTLPNALNAGDTTGNGTILNRNTTTVLPSTQTEDQSVDRIDHNIGEKIRLFGRFDWQKQNQLTTSKDVVNNGYGPTWARNAAAGYTHILTPNMVNDLRAGFNWIQTSSLDYEYENNIQNADTALGVAGYNYGTPSGDPGLIDITAGIFSISQSGDNWIQDDRTYQGYDQISWTRNKHSFMAGVDLRRLSLGRVSDNDERGVFVFTAGYTGAKGAAVPTPTAPTGVSGLTLGSSDASLYLGVASTTTSPLFQVKSQILQWRDGFFVQDTWQFSKRLTLEYGLRYELPQVATSANGNARILDPTNSFLIPSTTCQTPQCAAFQNVGFAFTSPNHKDIAPRLGFSYRVTDKIVVRGGGGIYFNANQLNAFTLANTNYPFSVSVQYQSPAAGATLYTPANQAMLVQLANAAPGAAATVPVAGVTPGSYVSAYSVANHLPSETMYQWNLDNGIELWKNAGLELQYLGTHSIHLNENNEPNQPSPCGCAPNSLTTSVNARRPNQNWGAMRVATNDATATYEGLTTVFRQRLARGLSANVSYTWSHALDETTDANNSGSAMWQGHLKLEYGNSPSDITNHVVASFSYTLPSLARHNFVLKEAIGGWQVSGVVGLSSGGIINVTTGTDWANLGVPYTAQRPNWVHTANQHLVDATHQGCTKKALLALPYATSPACLDPSAYAPPTQYTYGNMHRDDIHGLNGSLSNNLALLKNFTIYENVKFQLRMEGFNALNHANMGNPGSTTFTITANGTAAAPLPPTFNPSGSFGQASASGGRTMQLAGRITF